MATLHPAELFGPDQKGIGTIQTGSPADFIFYDQKPDGSWTIMETVSNGETVYEFLKNK
jgi:imidazolonepropionase-like amidohydrolase